MKLPLNLRFFAGLANIWQNSFCHWKHMAKLHDTETLSKQKERAHFTRKPTTEPNWTEAELKHSPNNKRLGIGFKCNKPTPFVATNRMAMLRLLQLKQLQLQTLSPGNVAATTATLGGSFGWLNWFCSRESCGTAPKCFRPETFHVCRLDSRADSLLFLLHPFVLSILVF